MIQTGYGKMAIEEYTPGKFRSVRVGESKTRAAGERSARTPSGLRGNRNHAEATTRTLHNGSSPPDDYDSKLEAARATYLGYLLLAKDIRLVRHHPFTVPLTNSRTYTPDFLVWWEDGRITVEEVKGSVESKNARDSITRLHVAASMFPMFRWHLVLRIRGVWEERLIHA